MKVRDIIAINKTANPDLVRVGELLKIPIAAAEITYQLVPGDTISGTAGSLGLPAIAIVKVDHISNPNRVKAGTPLLIPVELQRNDRTVVVHAEVPATTEHKLESSDEERIVFRSK